MGFCINSGPSWDDDYLNKINRFSIDVNALEMFHKDRNFSRQSMFPNVTASYTNLRKEDESYSNKYE
jgi:carbamate kinase